MKNENEREEPCFKRRYLIAFVAFLSFFLMNAHRMNISIAIVAMVNPVTHENHTISHDLNGTQQAYHYNSQSETQSTIKYDWGPQIQGFILGAGFFGYVLSLLIGGKLAETFGPRMMLISGTFASSFTTLITPLAPLVHVYFLIFIQCVRGIAQGFMLPSIAVLAANWYPKAERGLLAGIGLTGYQMGRLLGGVLSGFICDSIAMGGWPSVFYIFGGFGIFVSLIEFFTLYSMPKDDARVSRAELTCILANQENVLTQKNGIVVSMPYIIPFAIIPCVSFLSSWLNKKKYLTVDKIRKIWILFGTLTALSTTIASFVGFLVPVVSGALTNEENSVQQWTKFFIICIVVMLSSGIFFALFGSAEVQNYNFSSKDLPDQHSKVNNLQMEMKDGLEKDLECSPNTI